MAVLTPQIFTILSALIEEKSGLHYDHSNRDILATKLGPRMAEAGFESWLDYYYYLRYDEGGEAEMSTLIETLAVHETYLFREPDQLRALLAHVILPRARLGRKLRIWSAACATGEEPVTIAVMLADAGILDQTELLASDISEAALARARRGEMGRRSLREAVPEMARSRWIEVTEQGPRVAKAIMDRIDWRRVNLLDEAAIAELGLFDAILCRNVLIYFKEPTARRVVATLSQRLSPDGTLVVSVSESLLRFGTSLVCEEHGGAFFYRKATNR
jgi:chemotaxis protein methyltransferase CheR